MLYLSISVSFVTFVRCYNFNLGRVHSLLTFFPRYFMAIVVATVNGPPRVMFPN